MQVQLSKLALERFIQEQVKAGYFSSPEAAVEAAVTQMMLDRDALTEQDLADIEASDAEIDRGGYAELDDFVAAMRKKFCGG